ncbi:hypothetical protein MYG64_07440 [Ensifer adhaerens]|uniref:hypothetical protein n=1 Tax=Ensifer adhaerens TaxID=106592 RepID=UPI002101B0D3|nr:hypothetical protein [Ensifer adhaerens]UTV38119.1 hypothetical protein MYG64_07440 [Ensifer adhaerens]
MSAEEATQKKQVDWSSSFVRTRTEMTVTTVILLAVTHLDMSLTKIPGFGIELAHSAPRAGILAFLILFFLYFTAAFVVRFLTEYGDVKLPSDTLQGLDREFNGRVLQLVSFNSSPFSEEVRRYAETLTSALAEYRTATWRHVQRLAPAPDPSRTENIHMFKPETFASELPAVGTLLGDIERERIIEAHQRYLDRDKPRVAKVYHENVAHFETEAKNHLHTVNQTLDTFETKLAANVTQYQTALGEQAQQVKNELSATRGEIDRIRKQIRSLARVMTWDELWFGFIFPLAFALISFAYTLPQAIADMAPLTASVQKCFPPTSECFYRDPLALSDPNALPKAPH